MQRKMWKADPNWDGRRHILGRVEVRGPFVQRQPLRPHKIWDVLEDEIFILCTFKNEYEEAFPNEMAFDPFGD